MHRIAARAGVTAGTVVLTTVVLVLVVYLYGRFGFTNAGDLADPRMTNHADFDSFHVSATALWSGGDPYDPSAPRNLNPPAWMPLFSYFALFNGLVAYRMWVVGTIVALLAALTWTAGTVNASTKVALVGVTALMLSGPMQGTLWQGQVYALLALGLVAAWVLERRGRTTASAVVLGVLGGLKLSLLPMMLWPASHRRWRDLAAGAGGFVGSFAVGLCFGGPSATIGWARLLSQNNPQGGHYDNIALVTEAYRLFTPTPSSGHLANLPWAGHAATVVGLAIVGATLWLARYRTHAFWALVAACLLASPITWRGYVVLLVPAALILLADRRHRATGGLLIALVLVPNSLPDLWPDKSTVAASIGLALPCLVMLVFWAVLISVRSAASGAPSDSPVEPSGGAPDRAAAEREAVASASAG